MTKKQKEICLKLVFLFVSIESCILSWVKKQIIQNNSKFKSLQIIANINCDVVQLTAGNFDTEIGKRSSNFTIKLFFFIIEERKFSRKKWISICKLLRKLVQVQSNVTAHIRGVGHWTLFKTSRKNFLF
jgi:hypothetical protein